MTIILLRFVKNPAPEEDFVYVTEALHQINPDLRETERTENTITFSSPDHNADLYGTLLQAWLNPPNPLIDTYRMLAD
jgi:hypothetical protein